MTDQPIPDQTAYLNGFRDGRSGRPIRTPSSEPERSEYRKGYVEGARMRRGIYPKRLANPRPVRDTDT